ncbi:hypothetical protein HZA96_02870 [Candidatus Woesearchaeota archaeon]|nr:hypothetical protein [Candidatus Woesearchaeota archaeon]
MKKKSQTEIMGLLIIFIILSLIIMFTVSKVFFKKPSKVLDEYNQQQLSSSMISAFLKTSSFCLQDTDMEDLIVAVAKNNLMQCDSEYQSSIPNLQCKDISKIDDYLRCALKASFDNSLGQFNMPYQLNMKVTIGDSAGIEPFITLPEETDEKYAEKMKALKSAKSGSVEPYILPLSGSSANVVEIWLCINSECPEI